MYAVIDYTTDMEVGKVNASKVEVRNCVLEIGLDSDCRYSVINNFSF